jgi:hypothetical protein
MMTSGKRLNRFNPPSHLLVRLIHLYFKAVIFVTANLHNLHCHVHVPTRGDNILDLVFTSERNIIKDMRSTASLGDSDHCVFLWNLCYATERLKDEKDVKCFDRADNKGVRNYVHSRINDFKHWEESAEVIWKELINIFEDAINNYVPKISGAKKQREPLWMS